MKRNFKYLKYRQRHMFRCAICKRRLPYTETCMNMFLQREEQDLQIYVFPNIFCHLQKVNAVKCDLWYKYLAISHSSV